jgi:hypothetical protein
MTFRISEEEMVDLEADLIGVSSEEIREERSKYPVEDYLFEVRVAEWLTQLLLLH